MNFIISLLFTIIKSFNYMRSNGFFGIGCLNMKSIDNYGTLFRTAQILEADYVFVIGSRFKIQPSDTMKSWKHIPTYSYLNIDDFKWNRPYGEKIVGIEMCENAIKLPNYKHPKQACYLLGAEDYGLSDEAIDLCDDIIYLPGKRSMNVAVAGSIVLYDRHIKLNNF